MKGTRARLGYTMLIALAMYVLFSFVACHLLLVLPLLHLLAP